MPSQTFKVIRAAVHPRFQFSPAADRFDVAVLTLDRHVRYAPHIAPICLPEAGRDPEPGTTAYVAGWGALIPDDVSGNRKKRIQHLFPITLVNLNFAPRSVDPISCAGGETSERFTSRQCSGLGERKMRIVASQRGHSSQFYL